jgi:hypothetical protein
MITNPLVDYTLCSGAKTQPVDFTGCGTDYEWNVSGDIIDGLPTTPQIGDFGEYVLSHNEDLPLTAIITVTPMYIYGTKTCTGDDAMFSITVDPIPELKNIPPDYSLCSGETTTKIEFGADVSFTCTVEGGTIDGLPTGTVIGDFGEYKLENHGTVPLTAIVTITSNTDNANCLVKDTSFRISVVYEPAMDNVADDSLCDNQKTTPVHFMGTATGYTWKTSGGVSGIPANGAADFGSYTVTNKTSNVLSSTVTVTPIVYGTKCEGTPQEFKIFVIPTTKIDSFTTHPSAALCEDDTLSIEIQATGDNLTYQWYHDSTLLGEKSSKYYLNPVDKEHGGAYYVEVSGFCGNATSKPVTIAVRSSRMLIEKWHDVILVDNSKEEYTGYQWYKNGRIIDGAREQVYQEIGGLNGCYSVELRLKAGGRIRSCERCMDKRMKSGTVNLYPNPTAQGKSVTVNFDPEDENQNIENIEIITPNGQWIATQQVNQKSYEIETATLSAGMYVLKITTSDKQIYNRKMVVY